MGEGSISTIAATVPLDEELREREERGVWHRRSKLSATTNCLAAEFRSESIESNPRETNEMYPQYKRSGSLPQTPQHPVSSRASHLSRLHPASSVLMPFRLDLLSPTGGHSSLYGIITVPDIPLCRLFASHYHSIPQISRYTLCLHCNPLNSTANAGYIADAAVTCSEGSQPRTTYSSYPRGQERTPLESSQNLGLAQTLKNSGCHLRCWVC